MSRVVLLIDLDAFYASVEEREDPELKGKAVVVCMFSARGGDSGAVATPNYRAREAGVRSGMPISRAKKLAPQAVYLPARRDFYRNVSENVMEILRGYADSFEQVSIDEAYLDLTRSVKGNFNKAVKVAERIKKDILKKEGLPSSIGIGPNKLVAKIAAGMDKPDGLTLVRPEEVQDFLDELDVKKIPGVGARSGEILKEHGISLIRELRMVERQLLEDWLGKARGAFLYNASRGVDDEPVTERGEREQIGRITTLEEDTRDPNMIMMQLDRLAEEVHQRVVERRQGFRTVTFYAVMSDMKAQSRSKTLPFPKKDLDTIKQVSEELLKSFLCETKGNIRRVGVRVSNFEETHGQRTLLQF